MKNHNGMSWRIALAMGAVLAFGALSVTACKDDDKEGTAINGAGATHGAAGADGTAGAAAAGAGGAAGGSATGVAAGTRPRDGHGGTDAGLPGNGDIDNLIGGDGDTTGAAGAAGADAKPAVVPFAERDYSDAAAEANWRPEGLRVAYTGKKLPCDGSVILKGSPIDKTTAEVHLVDVNEGRVPIACIDTTTLILTMDDVPRTVKTIRFYDNKSAMTTLDVIGAKKR